MFKKIRKTLFGSKRNSIITIVIAAVVLFFIWRQFSNSSSTPQYQTAQVTNGTLVSSVSESGTVAVANRTSITTGASGIISNVYVKNGDTVTAGEKIADMTLDNAGQQRQAQSWASYLSAQSSLNNANASLYSLQSAMYSKWNTFYQLATNSTYQNTDGSPNTTNRVLPQFTTAQDDWLNTEALYQDQQNVIAQDQAALNSAWLSYEQSSSTITAPIAGVISDLTIASGLQVGGSNSTTGNGGSSSLSLQPVASIKTKGQPIIAVSLSEVDAAKVQDGNNATITFDALPNQTFTGKVIGINTTGVVTSGVTTYPTTIILDIPNDKILPNMSATANIITGITNNALMVPTAAVQSTGGQSTVNVLENGQITPTAVTTGATSDTDTQIISGLKEGQTVVVGYVSTGSSSTTSSPFSRSLFGGGGGGGAVFRAGGGGGGGAGRGN